MKRQKKMTNGGHGRVIARQKSTEVMNEKEKMDRLEVANVLSSLMYLPPKASDDVEQSPNGPDTDISRLTYIPHSSSGIPVKAPSKTVKTQSKARRGSGNSIVNNTPQKHNTTVLAELHKHLNFIIKASNKPIPFQNQFSIPSTVVPQSKERSVGTTSTVPSVVLNAETSKLSSPSSVTKTINRDVATALRHAVSQTKRAAEAETLTPEMTQDSKIDEKNTVPDDKQEHNIHSPALSTGSGNETVMNGNVKNDNDHSPFKKENTDTNLPLKKRRLVSQETNVSVKSNVISTQSISTPSLLSSRLLTATQVENIIQMARDYPEVMIGNSSKTLISNLASVKQPTVTDASWYRPVQFDPRTSLMVLSDVKYALTPDEDGDLPLHMAVVHENLELVKKYIDIMAMSDKKVDRFNKLMQTPLHLAVLVNNLPIVMELLKARASPSLVDRNGCTAIHLAVKKGFISCLEIILDVSKLNCDLNGRDFEGYPPLHSCVETDDINSLIVLKKHGADINVQDGKAGRSVLFYATEYNRLEMVDILLGWGANVELQNYAGVSAYMTSQAAGYDKISAKLHAVLEGKFTPELTNLTFTSSKKMAIPKCKVSLLNPDMLPRVNSIPMETTSCPGSRRPSLSSSPMDLTVTRPMSPGVESPAATTSMAAMNPLRPEDKAICRSVKEKHTQLVAALEGRNTNSAHPEIIPQVAGQSSKSGISEHSDTAVESSLNISSMTLQDLITKAQSEKNIQFLNQLNDHIMHRMAAMKAETQGFLTDASHAIIARKGVQALTEKDEQMEVSDKEYSSSVEELDALPSDSGSVAVSVSLEDGVTVDVHIKEEVDHADESREFVQHCVNIDSEKRDQSELVNNVISQNTDSEYVEMDADEKEMEDKCFSADMQDQEIMEVNEVYAVQDKTGQKWVENENLVTCKSEAKETVHEVPSLETSIKTNPVSPEMPTLSRAVSFEQDMDVYKGSQTDVDSSGTDTDEEQLPELQEHFSPSLEKVTEHEDVDINSSQESEGFEFPVYPHTVSANNVVSKLTSDTTVEKYTYSEMEVEATDVQNESKDTVDDKVVHEDEVTMQAEKSAHADNIMDVDDLDREDENPLVIDEHPSNPSKPISNSATTKKIKEMAISKFSADIPMPEQGKSKADTKQAQLFLEFDSLERVHTLVNDNVKEKHLDKFLKRNESKTTCNASAREERTVNNVTEINHSDNLENSISDVQVFENSKIIPISSVSSNWKENLSSEYFIKDVSAQVEQRHRIVATEVQSNNIQTVQQSIPSSRSSFTQSTISQFLVNSGQSNHPVKILVDGSKKTEALLKQLFAVANSKVRVSSVQNVSDNVPATFKLPETSAAGNDSHTVVVSKLIPSDSNKEQKITTETGVITTSLAAPVVSKATVCQTEILKRGTKQASLLIKDIQATKKDADCVAKCNSVQTTFNSNSSETCTNSSTMLKEKTCLKNTPMLKAKTLSESMPEQNVALKSKSPGKNFDTHVSSSGNGRKCVKGQGSQSVSLTKNVSSPHQGCVSGGNRKTTMLPSGRGPSSNTEGTLTRINPDIKNKLSRALQSPQRRQGITAQTGKHVDADTPFPNFQGLSGTPVSCTGDKSARAGSLQ